MDKIILRTAELNCSTDKAFEMFTKNEYLEQWLTVKAVVEPEVGGKFELYWDLNDLENDCTKGCKVLAVGGPNYLNFEWKGPKRFKEFFNMRPLTNITVLFIEEEDKTKITLLHTGWREGSEWEEARQYFLGAWQGAFKQLEELVSKNL